MDFMTLDIDQLKLDSY